MPRPRELKITLKPLQLILCIALGLWLGAVAIALSLWLAGRLLPATLQPIGQVLAPPAIAPASPATADPQNQMFEQYKQILRNQEVQQAEEQAQGSLRNLSNPKCQFWLQQNRTAPTEKSRALVLEFCN
ncbi:hypothetical protein ABE525_18065 [Pseudomonas wadenswilerensis]|jgi:hypothetical protein|uniref:hypothetical protein n=1 Tax=Pseudomonas TaxID=286 RepID=UPI000FA78993|nr:MULTISPECIES: hypothetical protein [Pseudomonas]MCE5981407.1 hypothetical protein [Pseudomonas sp. LF19]UVM20536.1 hypothetical protein LOY45_19125 [Pseudomonas wadenswilerensis]SPO65802.1 conserved exported protein of unknown function [Pseudomonas sp. JV241A]